MGFLQMCAFWPGLGLCGDLCLASAVAGAWHAWRFLLWASSFFLLLLVVTHPSDTDLNPRCSCMDGKEENPGYTDEDIQIRPKGLSVVEIRYGPVR